MSEDRATKLTKGIKVSAFLIPLLGYFIFEVVDSGYLIALFYTAYILFFIASLVCFYLLLGVLFDRFTPDRTFYLLLSAAMLLGASLAIFGTYITLLRLSLLSLSLAGVVFVVYKIALGRG